MRMRKTAHSGGKGWFFLVRVAAKKCKFIGEFSGERTHIPKQRCDFVESFCGWKVHIDRKNWRRKSAHSEGKVWFCFLLVAVRKCICRMRKRAHSEGKEWFFYCVLRRKSAHSEGKVWFCLLLLACFLQNAVSEHFWVGWNRKIWRRNSAHSEGNVWFYFSLGAVRKCISRVRKTAQSDRKMWFCLLRVAAKKTSKSAHSEENVWLCLLLLAC